VVNSGCLCNKGRRHKVTVPREPAEQLFPASIREAWAFESVRAGCHAPKEAEGVKEGASFSRDHLTWLRVLPALSPLLLFATLRTR
jgi:hypothetical protein